MQRPNLEGAACAEINMTVVDKFFDIDAHRDRLRAQAARNICARCVVQPECLEDALNGPAIKRGIVAGITSNELEGARSWRRYELGYRETPPRQERPDWLPRPEAAETVEQMRVEEELGVAR
jgi:hypothetical protein